jgi:hypothetical protein
VQLQKKRQLDKLIQISRLDLKGSKGASHDLDNATRVRYPIGAQQDRKGA